MKNKHEYTHDRDQDFSSHSLIEMGKLKQKYLHALSKHDTKCSEQVLTQIIDESDTTKGTQTPTVPTFRRLYEDRKANIRISKNLSPQNKTIKMARKMPWYKSRTEKQFVALSTVNIAQQLTFNFSESANNEPVKKETNHD